MRRMKNYEKFCFFLSGYVDGRIVVKFLLILRLGRRFMMICEEYRNSLRMYGGIWDVVIFFLIGMYFVILLVDIIMLIFLEVYLEGCGWICEVIVF